MNRPPRIGPRLVPPKLVTKRVLAHLLSRVGCEWPDVTALEWASYYHPSASPDELEWAVEAWRQLVGPPPHVFIPKPPRRLVA